MKPGSIIVLIIAVILVIAGVITCLAAAGMAKNNGRDQELFTQYRDGKTYLKQDFKSSDVTRIEIRVPDAEIRITGGAPTSYVEVGNYDPNTDTVSTNQSSVVIEKSDKSAAKFWENGFSFFKGFRNLFHTLTSGKTRGKMTINVYLGDKTSVSLVDVEARNCDITLDGIDLTDKIKVSAEKCVMKVTDSSAGSAITVESPSSKLELDSVTTDSLNVSCEGEIDLVAVNCSFKNTAVTAKDGRIDIGNVQVGEKIAYDITSKSGTVTVDGAKAEEGYRKAVDGSDALIKIAAETAQITYTNVKPEELPAPAEAGESDG